MTAAELVAKQDRQLRIDAHVQADRKAKRAEFDLRYGNNKQLPRGHAKPVSRVRRPRYQPSALVQLLIGVAAVLVGAVALHSLLNRI